MKNLLLIALAVSLFTFISCSVTLEKPEEGKKVEESVVDNNEDEEEPAENSSEEVGDTKEDGTENHAGNISLTDCVVWTKSGAFFKIDTCTGFDDDLKRKDEPKQTPKVDEASKENSEVPTKPEKKEEKTDNSANDELLKKYTEKEGESYKVGSCVRYEGVINNPTGGESDFQTSLKVESFDGKSGTMSQSFLIGDSYSSETLAITIEDGSLEEDNCVNTEIEVVDVTVKAGTFEDALYLKGICGGYVSELWLHGEVPGMIVKITDTSIGFEEEVAKIGSGTDCDIEYANEEETFNSDETSVDDSNPEMVDDNFFKNIKAKKSENKSSSQKIKLKEPKKINPHGIAPLPSP